jgi:hypothetical protein
MNEKTKDRVSFLDRTKQFNLAIPPAWNGTTKHIASVLFTFAGMDDGGGITASAATIARHSGEPLSTVKRVLKFLVEGGFLVSDGEVEHRNGTHTKARRLVLDKFLLVTQEEDQDVTHETGPSVDQSLTHETLTRPTSETRPVSPVRPKPRGITESITESSTSSHLHQQNDTVLPFPVTKRASPTEAPTERKSPTRKSTGAAYLPTEWQPDESGIAFAKERGVIDVPATLGAFHDHHAARGNKYRDWAAAWRTWCRNDEKWRPSQRTNKTPPDPTDPWGLKAWLAGPNAPVMKPGEEACRWTLGQYTEVMEDIGLPETWRGDLSILGRWSVDRFDSVSVQFVLRQWNRRAYTSIGQVAWVVDQWAQRYSPQRGGVRIPDEHGRGFNEGQNLPRWLERRAG